MTSIIWYQAWDSNPHAQRAQDPKSCAAANYANLALLLKMVRSEGVEPPNVRVEI